MHAQLRVLFTINPSYQYIRAGSPGSVPVVPLPDAGHQNPSTSAGVSPPTSIRYGTVSLRPCMEAIRRSSPELVQNRDFTVYVLDPLEGSSTLPMVQIPQNDATAPQVPANLPGTVAVGYGLMSDALAAKDNESPQVVGTFTLTHGREAIEVVFALRETEAAHSQAVEPPLKRHRVVEGCYANVPAATNISAPRPSTSSRKSKATKPPKPQLPLTESERLLQSSTTYFGPPRKKGRPRVDKSSSTIISGSDDSKFHTTSSIGINGPNRSISTQPHIQASCSTAGTTIGSHSVQISDIQNIVELVQSSSPEQLATNVALLSALNNMDSDPLTLGLAIKQAIQNLARQAPPTPQQPVKSEPQDDEVVILDKENVNPTAFRKRSQRELEKQPSGTVPAPASNPGVLIARNTVTNPGEPGQSATYFGSSSRSNTIQRVDPILNSHSQLPASATGSRPLRKRTLSQFMEEKEARSQTNRSHESSSETGESPPRVNLRHYPRLADTYSQPERPPTNYYRTGFEPFSSPPRPARNLSDGENSQNNPILVPDSPLTPRVTASSPPRPSASKSRKKFILPEWARTETATKPRLSEDAQRAIEEARERKKEEKLSTKRKGNAAALAKSKEHKLKQRLKSAGSAPSLSIRSSNNTPKPSGSFKENDIAAAVQTGPIAASTSFNDVFASRNGISTTSPLHPPKTPPRTRTVLPCTPSKSHDRSSLFTPTPKSFGSRSPLFSPFGASPSPNRRQSTVSPTKSPSMGKNLSRPGAWGESLQLPTDESEKETDMDDDFLSRGLESCDDSEPPSSSLPVPTSDLTVDDVSPSANDGDDEAEDGDGDADAEDALSRVKDLWKDLPPSSPPPPTSPCLQPDELPFETDHQTDDDESEDELPMATSDVEPEESSATPPEDFVQTPAPPIDELAEEALVMISQGEFVQDLFKIDDWLQYTTLDMLSSDDNYHNFTENAFNEGLQTTPDKLDMTELWGEVGGVVLNQIPNLLPPIDPAGTGLVVTPQDLLKGLDPSRISNEDGNIIAMGLKDLLSGCVL